MTNCKLLTLSALAAALFTGVAVAPSPAQISVGIGIGAEPGCPYGYYDYAPYNCSPYGYYGPDFFNGGVFIGAGPWYHGRAGFYGHVDNRYDPNHGYAGPFPSRGEQPFNGFHGNEARDGQGHIGNAGHAPEGEHNPGFGGHGSPGGNPGGSPGGSHGGGHGH